MAFPLVQGLLALAAMSFRASLPLLAVVLVAAPLAISNEGCAEDASSAPAGDAGSSSSGSVAEGPSPCSAGRTRYVTLEGDASGGTLVAFGDCLDSGTIPPTATEGDCRLYAAATAFEPGRFPRSYVAHGVVRATQASTWLAAEVASADLKTSFSSKLASGEPVQLSLGKSAAHDAEELAVVAPSAATYALAAGASRAKGITVTWGSGKAGESFELSLRTDPSGRVLRCTVDAGKGQLTVAPSLLADWPNGEYPLEVVTETKASGADGSTTAWVRVRAAASAGAAVTF